VANSFDRQYESIRAVHTEMALFFKELRLAGLRVVYIEAPWYLDQQCVVDILDPDNHWFTMKLVCDNGIYVVRWSERAKKLCGDTRWETTDEVMDEIRQVVAVLT
jgi:hypothetical protein